MKMTSKWMCSLVAALLAPCVMAGPAVEKRDPVAAGFPDWQGLTAKNRVTGRALMTRAMTPSDLRHKVVVVIQADVTDLKNFQTEQLPLVSNLSAMNSRFGGFEASLGTLLTEQSKVPRNTVVLLSLRGKPSDGVVEAFNPGKDENLRKKIGQVGSSYCPIYYNAGMVGEPENAEGKYPFAYVLDGKSNEPVWKGVLTGANIAEVTKAVQAARKDLPEWTPLTGVSEAKFHTSAFKQIKEGKFKAAQKSLLGGVKSKDAESAAEAQKMFDAIQQYQTDTAHFVERVSSISPALAYSELAQFTKLFPTAKKTMAGQIKPIMGRQGAQQLGDIVTKIRRWTSEDYHPKAAEVKKNIGEITKWKKVLAQFEKSQDMTVQGDAMFLSSQLESIQAQLEAKIAK